MRVGELGVTPIVDAEGTFATVHEVLPAITDELEAEARRRSPELFRGEEGEGFGWKPAKEDATPVE